MELPSSGIVDNQIEFQDPETDIFPRYFISILNLLYKKFNDRFIKFLNITKNNN